MNLRFKNRNLFFLYSLVLIFSFSLLSCFGPHDLSNRNLSGIYGREASLFHPDFTVFHADTSSVVFIKLNRQEFLYMRQPDDRFKGSLTIHAKLVESYDNMSVLDSNTRNFEFFRNDTVLTSIYTVPFHMPPHIQSPKDNPAFKSNEPKGYLLLVTIIDNNRNAEDDFFVNVENSVLQNRNSFMAVSNKNGQPLFRNYIYEKDTVRLLFKDPSVKTVFVSYYHRSFILSAPPFSFDIHDDFDYKADSIFKYSLDTALTLPREGFYHFQVDTSEKAGFTLYRFPRAFPAVTTPDQMIEAARYLTTKKEYEGMMQDPNRKASIERFWLDIGNNADRTRTLIKKYYTRVQEANRYFSSHTEGWRTDRGMVYIIFGKPNNVYKSANAESWIYGQPNNALSLNFFFVRVNNPFTDNDYTLNREPIYEGSWYRAVDIWRQGRAYNDQ